MWLLIMNFYWNTYFFNARGVYNIVRAESKNNEEEAERKRCFHPLKQTRAAIL